MEMQPERERRERGARGLFASVSATRLEEMQMVLDCEGGLCGPGGAKGKK